MKYLLAGNAFLLFLNGVFYAYRNARMRWMATNRRGLWVLVQVVWLLLGALVGRAIVRGK